MTILITAFALIASPLVSAFTGAGGGRIAFKDRRRPGCTSLFSSAEEQIHAREVFTLVDTDHSDTIDSTELGEMLRMLDIDASVSDADALFKYLDANGDGEIRFEDFAPWYSQAEVAAKSNSDVVQANIRSRRAVGKFDQTPVADDVLRRAIQCAIAAPNKSMSEPWRFIKIGHETVEKISRLNTEWLLESGHFEAAGAEYLAWVAVPGWCVVTTKLTPEDPIAEEHDFGSTVCAIQNFMLSMWSEGIGTRWLRGPVTRMQEFADLCGVDTEEEKVVGCIWYGFVSGGLLNTSPWERKRGVDDVLSIIP